MYDERCELEKEEQILSLIEKEEVDVLGRSLTNGRFVKGKAKPGPGRPKGSRNKMTNQMLTRVFERSEHGQSMEEIMMNIAQSDEMPPELRFKAAKAVADLVYPKVASVDLKIDDLEEKSIEQIDDQLKQLIALASNRDE